MTSEKKTQNTQIRVITNAILPNQWYWGTNEIASRSPDGYVLMVNAWRFFLKFSSDMFFFVCLEFIVPLENFSLIWRRHHCRWRAANFDLCSALTTIEQWGSFNVPHPLRHGPTVYNGHLRGPVTITPVNERLAVELSLPVLIEPRSPACEANVLPQRHRGGS